MQVFMKEKAGVTRFCDYVLDMDTNLFNRSATEIISSAVGAELGWRNVELPSCAIALHCAASIWLANSNNSSLMSYAVRPLDFTSYSYNAAFRR